MPIAHGDGNYYAEPDVVARLERNRQVIFRYVSASGDVTDEANPNGSLNNIAGICNEARNVVGLMPHPERACELAIGSADGMAIFESILKWGRESFNEDTLTTMTASSATVLNK
jgi:phosphoribosylformylglycinamidine synthase